MLICESRVLLRVASCLSHHVTVALFTIEDISYRKSMPFTLGCLWFLKNSRNADLLMSSVDLSLTKYLKTKMITIFVIPSFLDASSDKCIGNFMNKIYDESCSCTLKGVWHWLKLLAQNNDRDFGSNTSNVEVWHNKNHESRLKMAAA